MCGINGIVWKNISEKNSKKFYESAQLTRHRGPDFTGRFGDETVDLVHHRLSILDLDPRAHQPFFNHDQTKVLIYNGEIYNYLELKNKYGLVTHTTSDTEVLMLLMESQGSDILKELNGIFAFALYDTTRGTITLARDGVGVKPLYYFEDSKVFIFSSEAKVILNYLESFEINFQTLSEFLNFGSSISTKTLIQGLEKVSPGQALNYSIKEGITSHEIFWKIRQEHIPHEGDYFSNTIIKTEDLFRKAVQRQCMSDVPVGAYLSGGIDSSAIVAYASQYVSGKLNTYSVEFDYSENQESELPAARKVSQLFNTNHHEFQVETRHLEEDLEAIIFQYDEPYADPAALPLHLLAKACSGLSKVVLQGDGGDEVFAGYGRHLDLSQFKLRQAGSGIFSILHPSATYRRAMKNKARILNQKDPGRRMAIMVSNGFEARYDGFEAPWQSRLQESNPYLEYEIKADQYAALTPLEKMLYTDLEIILPNTFLEKVDKINMLHSIEARVPFLDQELVTYAAGIPGHYKIRKGVTKYFLREMLKNTLPPEILKLRKKSFGTPINAWLRTTLYGFVKEKFIHAAAHYPFINAELLLHQLETHSKGTENHSTTLWRSAVLITWLGFYADKIKNLE